MSNVIGPGTRCVNFLGRGVRAVHGWSTRAGISLQPGVLFSVQSNLRYHHPGTDRLWLKSEQLLMPCCVSNEFHDLSCTRITANSPDETNPQGITERLAELKRSYHDRRCRAMEEAERVFDTAN